MIPDERSDGPTPPDAGPRPAKPAASAKARQNLALLLGMEGRLNDAERLMREDLPPEVADNNLAYLRAVSAPAR